MTGIYLDGTVIYLSIKLSLVVQRPRQTLRIASFPGVRDFLREGQHKMP